MNILGIIPARGGSKRTPRKNIKMIAGKPLIAHTIEAGLKSKLVNRVVVSTEDAEIAQIALSFGAEVVKRPHELAVDTAKTAPVVRHVVEQLELQGYVPDIVVLLQPTCPARDEKIIDAALTQLLNSDKDSILGAIKIGKSMPKWKKGFDGKNIALYDYHFRPRTQEPHLMEDLYAETGAFYAIRIDAFKKTGDFLGEDVDIFEMKPSVDIDTPEDFARAEQLLLEKAGTKA
ncbi:MAG TPA: acylneuraminate cytidylyltransferase [Cyanobacteria bacterium UBA9971]|nr:acylneuraminate cytidylyltransferase [Cyanobacteria bacterium UBA9971]